MDNPFTKLDPVAKTYEKIKTVMPTLFATIGKHSEEKPKMPTLFATIGKHSQEKKRVAEAVDLEKDEVPDWAKNDVYSPDGSFRSVWDSVKRPEVKDPHKNFPTHYGQYTDAASAIKQYAEGSSLLNSTLHKAKGNLDDSIHPDLVRHTKSLDAAFGQKSHGDAVVYSGLHISPSEHFKTTSEVHTVFHHPAFLSASTSPRVADTFSRIQLDQNKFDTRNAGQIDAAEHQHILRLHIPKGSRAISVSGGNHSRTGSNMDGEQEVLVQRGAHIKIHRTPTHLYEKHGIHTFLWHGELVGHSFTADGDKLD